MKERWEWVSLVTALAAALAVCGASLYRYVVTPGTKAVPNVWGLGVENLGLGTKKDDVKSRDIVTEIISVPLSQGNYLVGENMPAGTYQLYAWNDGEAEVFVYENSVLAAQCRVVDHENAVPYATMTWQDGQYVIVKGAGVGAYTETDVTYEKVEYWGYYQPHQCNLGAGEFQVGKDIPAGIYNFVIYTDQLVTVDSSHPYEGGISLVCAPTKEYEYFYYDGVRLQEGDMLSIQGDALVEAMITIP